MNTTITIKIVRDGEEKKKINAAIDEAFGEFDRIVEKYTRFDEKSELSELNSFFQREEEPTSVGEEASSYAKAKSADRLASEDKLPRLRENKPNHHDWFSISKEFYELIDFMLKMAKDTDGAYDPTVIDFLEMYGYDKDYDFSKLDDPELSEKIKKALKDRPSWRDIKLIARRQGWSSTPLRLTSSSPSGRSDKHYVSLAPNQRIDLGGCGKGYAIDCAFEKLREGAKNFMIDGGGDVRCSGDSDKGRWWELGLLTRLKDEADIPENTLVHEGKVHIGNVVLKDEALASSGSWARKVKSFHHLMDPTTGKPVERDYDTVFVQAPTAIEADAWATAIFVGGRELAKKAPESLKVMFV